MESHENARELLREADRAEASPWVDFPPTPRWYPTLVGVWGAGLMLTLGVLGGVVQIAALIVLAVAVGVFAGWYRGYRGAMPSGGMPREFRSPALRFVIAQLVLFGATTAIALNGPPLLAATLVLALEIPLVTWYERAYAAAAEAAKVRLG